MRLLDRIADPTLRRWAFDVSLLYGLFLAAGVLIGISGAIGGNGAVTGESVTVIHHPHPAHDPPGAEVTVATPSDDPEPALLIWYPLLALVGTTLVGLPLALVGLGAAELLSRAGVRARTIRIIACIPIVPFALLVLIQADGTQTAAPAVALLAFVALVRLPGPAPPEPESDGRDQSPPVSRISFGWARGPLLACVAFAVASALGIGAQIAWVGTENGDCGSDGASFGGILDEVPSELKGDGSFSYSLELGELKVLPPGIVCRAYVVPPEGGDYVLGAEKTYPDPASYTWVVLFVFSPLPLWWLATVWRGRRGRSVDPRS